MFIFDPPAESCVKHGTDCAQPLCRVDLPNHAGKPGRFVRQWKRDRPGHIFGESDKADRMETGPSARLDRVPLN
jgi:hypothetical protein